MRAPIAALALAREGSAATQQPGVSIGTSTALGCCQVRRGPGPVLPALAGGEFRSSRIHIDCPYSYCESERSGRYPLYPRLQRERRAPRVCRPIEHAGLPWLSFWLVRRQEASALPLRKSVYPTHWATSLLCTARVGFRLQF